MLLFLLVRVFFMACLETVLTMYNNSSSSNNHQNPSSDHRNKASSPMMTSPRISFSNDFVEQPHSHPHSRYRDAPSDFEFSVSNYSMMSADELFSKGRLLPLKESTTVQKPTTTTTLRDELLNPSEDEESNGSNNSGGGGEFTLRPPKNPNRWRGFLGLGKSHIGSKKSPSSDNGGSNSCSNSSSSSKGGVVEKRMSGSFQFQHDDVQCSSKNSQDFDD